jgi:putative DNA methylase
LLSLNEGGFGGIAYGEAVSTYLSLSLDKSIDSNSSLCSWQNRMDRLRNTFGRQALPMVWDFAETNPFAGATGDFLGACKSLCEVLDKLEKGSYAFALQKDVMSQSVCGSGQIISTDPPYYDNVGYADLSDFFYIWLRKSLRPIYPDLFSTLLVPKTQELVATPYRFEGSKQKAQAFFENGLGQAFNRMHEASHSGYPLTVYYAFKQAEAEKTASNESIASTGWETMLEGLIKADFSIGGTWPMRTELSNRTVASGSNALASSIVLVCRPRPTDADKITRRQFLSELKRELPKALKTLQQGNVAPVDLAQASIGPGMAVFSKYAAVLENDGSPMRVRTALQLINQVLDEFLTEQEGEFDGDTRWALTWFEQYRFEPGQYGDAETLSKAKNTSVQGMVEAGILEAKAGKVRLLKREELKPDWNPQADSRMPDWEVAQYLIRELDQHGETGAADLLAKVGDRGEVARDLAYRLYNLCDRKGWAQEGIAYNSLVISWPEITRLASEIDRAKPIQGTLGV